MKNALILILILSLAFSYQISPSLPGKGYVGEEAQLTVQVFYDNGTVVKYPKCSVTIDSSTYEMVSRENDAVYYYTPLEPGEHSIQFSCYNSTALELFEVLYPTTIYLQLPSSLTVGEVLDISARYVNTYDESEIPGASCTASVYVNGDFLTNIDLWESDGEYIGGVPISREGSYRVEVTCSSQDYYDTATVSGTVEVSMPPVEISLSTSYVTGTFGKKVRIPFSVSPPDASCTSSSGYIIYAGLGRKELEIDVDFTGERVVRITCSAPKYKTTERTVKIKGVEAPTALELSIFPSVVYSFQELFVIPNYIARNTGLRIREGSCTVKFGSEKRVVEPGKSASFEAPPGPAKEEVTAECDAYGYERAIARKEVYINPAPLRLKIKGPSEVKKGEKITFQISLDPEVEATCTLTGELVSDLGEKERISKEVSPPSFSLFLNSSGKFKGTIKCHSLGYAEAQNSFEVEVKIFSRTEETTVAIVLTTLTLLLLAGFMLLRRWM